jgi:hypothetical protein
MTTRVSPYVLANTAVSPGTYGGSSQIPVITIDSQGRTIAASNVTVTIPPSTSIYANYAQLTANASTGDVAIGLATIFASPGTYNYPTIIVDQYGRVSSAANGANADLAFTQANNAYNTANSACIYANTGINNATSASSYANTGINNAASASLYANTGVNNAASASLYANTGINNAASASLYANAGITLSQASYNAQNSTATVANTGINNAASASLYANTGINNAASASLYANTGINNSASASLYANNSNTLANTANTTATASFLQANTGINNAASASSYANTGINNSASASLYANTGINNAASASLYANNALSYLSSNNTLQAGINTTQNTNITTATNNAASASLYANSGITLAQAAFNQGNSTATIANNKFDTAGGNITGNVTITNNKDLTVTGNLYVQGNTVSINTSSFTVQDALIVLALGNYTTDTKDIGFAGHYNDGSNAHTGLIRDYSTKEYYFFKGYTPELDANDNVDINHASFSTANVNANFFKGNVIANGVNLGTHTQSAFNQANTGVNNAASASTYANTGINNAASASLYANTGINNAASASLYANTGINNAASASSYANTGINNAASASLYANSGITLAQAAYNQANTANGIANTALQNTSSIITAGSLTVSNNLIVANTISTSGSGGNISGVNIVYANSINTSVSYIFQDGTSQTTAAAPNVYSIAAFTQANTAVNNAASASLYANSAARTAFNTISANGTTISATSNTDTITWTAAVANGINILNPSSKTIDLGLRTTGVIATTYGNTSSIPAITVDAFGRVTAVSNTAISIPSGTSIYANSGQLTTNASTGTVAIGLATVGAAGTYGNNISIPVITTDAYGRVTTVSNTTIAITGGNKSTSASTPPSSNTIGDIWYNTTTDALYRWSTDGTSYYWLDVSGATYANSYGSSGVTAGVYGGSSNIAVITIASDGRVTSASNTAVSITGKAIAMAIVFGG